VALKHKYFWKEVFEMINAEEIGVVYRIPVADLQPHPLNPYQVRDDDAMEELAASVRKHGVLVPVIARRKDDGFELIAGHRRQHAAQRIGMETIPVLVLDLDDDDAIIQLVDSNIQREGVLPSERAWAYKLRMDAMKHKAGRPSKEADKNSPKISANFRSDDELGEKAGVSGDTIRNYISLTNLIPELMQMVDEKKIALTPAYQIATLPQREQALLFETIESEQATPSLSQAQRMKKLSQLGGLNEDTMLEIMMEQKKPVRNDITLSGEKLRKYFPKSYTPLQMENTIFKLLDLWLQKRQRNQSQ
jgi:ParB family chromosome partitioning protein